MSLVAHAEALATRSLGPAWTEVVFPAADDGRFAASRWDVTAGTRTTARRHEDGETVLYVAEGGGRLLLADGTVERLAAETVVWLEPGDEYRLEADGHGLAVIVASAGAGAAR